jgi:hypothetical protein
MIIYEVRYEEDQGDGNFPFITEVEWFRNKARAEKRKREISKYAEWVEDIVQHTIPTSKDGFVWFLNCRADRDNG